MLLPLTLGGLVLFGASSALPRQGGLASIAVCPSLDQQNRNASDVIAQDIRRAYTVQSLTSNRFVLKTHEGDITYFYDAAARTLTRSDDRDSETLLVWVDSFAFALLQRGVPAASYTFAPATADHAKLVACRWSCSQKVAGIKLDSDTFQMTPVVLRNR